MLITQTVSIFLFYKSRSRKSHLTRRVASGGAGGAMPPRFSFLPPDFFLAPHGVFLGGRSWCIWAGKTLKFAILARKSLRISAKTFFFWRSPAFDRKICDFSQKKPSDFGEDLFLFCRSPAAFGRKICDFGQKNPSHFGENLCPPDFNFAPPISRSWRRHCISRKYELGKEIIIFKASS